jgi:hypothetical protein
MNDKRFPRISFLIVALPLYCLPHALASPAEAPPADVKPARAVKEATKPMAAMPLTMPVASSQAIWAAVQDKNFYLLSLLEKSPALMTAINSNAVLKKMATERAAQLKAGFNGGVAVDGATTGLLWSEADIAAASDALRQLYRSQKAVKEMVDGPLRKSGMYERYSKESGEELLAKAWTNDVGGLNHVIQVYGLGGAPHYPKIDSPFYDVKSPFYAELTNILFGVLAEDESAQQLFFQPSLRAALGLLDANRRDESGRFEPLERGENAAAIQKVKTIAWDKYSYSLILAPGQGPDEPQVVLSPKEKLVLGAIARRYREGKAPFILVSGGYVHPTQTPFCEAIEMKKSLMMDYGVPENAILIDPHARHTTTNMRNAARLIYRYGIPAEKNALITTTPAQIRSIDNPKFLKRCAKELGYQPAQYGTRVSAMDLEFLPMRESLQIDPTDPLDP